MERSMISIPPVHPGEILQADLLQPLGLTCAELARQIRVPVARIREIVRGRRAISADTALRLARYFDSTPEFWLNLQSRYELELVRRTGGNRIEREIRPRRAA